MATLDVPLPTGMEPGTIVVIPLPEGDDWMAPEGWRLEGRTLVGTLTPRSPATLRLSTVPEMLCGLCGAPILPDDLTLSRRGLLAPLQGAVDSHQRCYDAAVEVKVAQPGGPARPAWATPPPPNTEPVRPDATPPTGARADA